MSRSIKVFQTGFDYSNQEASSYFYVNGAPGASPTSFSESAGGMTLVFSDEVYADIPPDSIVEGNVGTGHDEDDANGGTYFVSEGQTYYRGYVPNIADLGAVPIGSFQPVLDAIAEIPIGVRANLDANMLNIRSVEKFNTPGDPADTLPFMAFLPQMPQFVWEHAARSLTDKAGFSLADKTGFSLADKTGFELSATANTAIAARVEEYFMSDALGGDFKAQLVAKLNELLPELDNLSVLAIAAAVRDVLFDAENQSHKLKIGENGTIFVNGVSLQDFAGEIYPLLTPLAKEATLVQTANIALDAKTAAENGFGSVERSALDFVASKAAKMKFGQRFTSDGRLEILDENGEVLYTQTRELNEQGATTGLIPVPQNG